MLAAVSVKFLGDSLELEAPIIFVTGAYGTRIFSVSADNRFLLQVAPGTGGGAGLEALSSFPVQNHIVVLRNWVDGK